MEERAGVVYLSRFGTVFAVADRFVPNRFVWPRPVSLLQHGMMFSDGVKIVTISEYFRDRFFRKIEEPVGAGMLQWMDISTSPTDHEIAKAAGGPECLVMELQQVFELLSRQPNCRGPGSLAWWGPDNLFYCLDKDDAMQSVLIRQAIGGWHVSAEEFSSKQSRRGCRLFTQMK